jgi:tetratricopeptide (TPR) repeat protein
MAPLGPAEHPVSGARPLFERALAIWERVLGPDHPQTAQGLNNLALLLKDQGEVDAARALFERALAIRERVLGPDHPTPHWPSTSGRWAPTTPSPPSASTTWVPCSKPKGAN